MNKQYILYPGHVVSHVDRQHHFIGAPRLAALYGVPFHRCVVYTGPASLCGRADVEDLIPLRPLSGGHYARHLDRLIEEHAAYETEVL